VVRLLISFVLGLLLTRVMHHIVFAFRSEKNPLLSNISCSSCQRTHSLPQQIPWLGVLLSLGKCPSCGARNSLAYLLLDFFSPVFIAWMILYLEPIIATELILAFVALATLALIDIKTWLIPNNLLILLFGVGLLRMANHWDTSINHMITACAVFIYFGMIMLIQKLFLNSSGLGVGDLKLAMVIGFWLGPLLSVYVFFLATLFALIYWLTLGLIKGIKMDRRIQFGPFIALSALIMGVGRALDPHISTTILTWNF